MDDHEAWEQCHSTLLMMLGELSVSLLRPPTISYLTSNAKLVIIMIMLRSKTNLLKGRDVNWLHLAIHV